MKRLVLYYSYDGNTKFIAESIAKEINAEIAEIKTKKTINATGVMKVTWGVRQLISQSEPDILELENNPSEYDFIIIGSPVWSFTLAPPVRTYLKNHLLSDKKIGIYCCHGGDKGKTLEEMKRLLTGNSIIGECDFLEPLNDNKENSKIRAINWARKLVD